MPTNRRLVIALICAVAAATLAAGCASSPSLVVGQGSDRFPDESFTDWVSYADQLSVVSVLSEVAEQPSSEVLDRGEGYISRTVVLRIEKTLWRRAGAPSADGTIPVITDGWVLDHGGRHPFAVWGDSRLEVGQRYLTPLVRAPRDGVEWTPLSGASTLPLAAGAVTTQGIAGAPSPLAQALSGSTPEDLAALLARTPADPIAVKHFDVDPDARVQSVLAER